MVEVLAATAFVTFLSRPRSAPGPSDELLSRERRARKAVEVARTELRKGSDHGQASQEGKQQLAEAKRELTNVERELEEAGADLKAFPVPPFLQATQSSGQIRIAVTGASGVGKSSYINALRRLRPNDKDAAPTGVTETTMVPTMYRFRGQSSGPLRRALDQMLEGGKKLVRAFSPLEKSIRLGDRVLLSGLRRRKIEDGTLAEVVGIYPDGDVEVQLVEDGAFVRCRREQVAGALPECVLFDLPGVGTPRQPQATYLRDMGLRHFDFVVLITSTRFTEAELLLLEGLEYWSVPYFLVRSKVDVDVQSEIDKVEEIECEDASPERKKEIEMQTIQSIREFFQNEFGLNTIYMVSSRRKLMGQFDFRKLEADMEVALRKQRLSAVGAKTAGDSGGPPEGRAREASLGAARGAGAGAPGTASERRPLEAPEAGTQPAPPAGEPGTDAKIDAQCRLREELAAVA